LIPALTFACSILISAACSVLRLSRRRKLAFQGVSGKKEVAYLHRVDLVVRGLSSITLDVVFTDSMVVGIGLLGQRGFFEQFQISFQLEQKSFDVIPNTPGNDV
jgi:hypothetical protein